MIVIVDYGSGNLRSVEKACARAAGEAGYEGRICISSSPADLATASHIILPGVGAMGDCVAAIAAREGLRESLERRVIGDGIPYLGICVGMQIMADTGHEHGTSKGFGWIGGRTERLVPSAPDVKIPHMGWNALCGMADHPLLRGLTSGAHMYFAHSYIFRPLEASCVLARVEHGVRFVAMLALRNRAGVQFHPEKSQKAGLRLLANFLAWDGKT